MQSQTCAYTSGIASTMAAAGMGAPDPSAFTRLAGLTPAALTGRFSAAAAASSRNPYTFAYENFKSSPHTSGLGHHSAPYNQLIRLDDIRNYAGHQAQAAAAAASAEHFGMLMKQQQQQQQQQQRDPRESAY
uniref:Uncharacterized protein n=1 Tax=Romanomermis culicivorax TaxID=13658 RepID=A0A915JTN6_ROMCU